MRVKNDTCIKWAKLAETMFLTNEEFGALIRNVMLADDENELRFLYLADDTIEMLLKREKEWKEQFEKMQTINPMVCMAYASVYGQVSHSHEAFKQKQSEYDEKDEEKRAGKNKNQEIKQTFTVQFKTYQHEFTAILKKKNIGNLPRLKDLQEITETGPEYETYDIIEQIFEKGNEDGWNNLWMIYIPS